MQNQSRNPNQDKQIPSAGSQQQNSQQEDARRKDQGQNANRQAENDEKEAVLYPQEQNSNSDSRSENSNKPETAKERSFYKNDLPENEEGTDVDEQSRNAR